MSVLFGIVAYLNKKFDRIVEFSERASENGSVERVEMRKNLEMDEREEIKPLVRLNIGLILGLMLFVGFVFFFKVRHLDFFSNPVSFFFF